MKKHGEKTRTYSQEEAHVDTIVVRKDGTPADPENTSDNEASSRKKAKAEKKARTKKNKKRFHIYVAVLILWLVACTYVIMHYYGVFNDFLVNYEASYQASQPELTMEEVFTHFEDRDIEYLWAHMSEHPTVSQFEDEETVKRYMLDMIEGKTLTYIESGEYTSEHPAYTIEADGYVIGSVTLSRDVNAQREYGFPTWVLSDISFPALALEGATITLPSNSTVYINDIPLDETYITEETTVDEDQLQYVAPYGGNIPGFTTYAISGLYYEPEVTVKDFNGIESPLEYNEATDIYSATYTTNHPEREMLEQFGLDFTTTFANVISRDANISELDPYFPPDSLALDYISRSTALRYFTAHGAVTIENQEVQEFIAYQEDTVYMQVYIEQWMQMGWGEDDIEVVPTTTHIYLVNIDGEWQVSGTRY